jgi:hypothetical protein
MSKVLPLLHDAKHIVLVEDESWSSPERHCQLLSILRSGLARIAAPASPRSGI